MTGRTIPVTRTDGSEVASEVTQALIHDQLDLKNSEVVADLRGAGGKTLTDLHNDLTPLATAANQTTANSSLSSIDSGIGGASAAAAGDTGASTTNGFLRWMRDFWLAIKGTKTAANSLSVTGASDGYFVVGGSTADGATPAAGVYSVMAGGKDVNGNKRTLLLNSGGELPTFSPALTITENWNAALTASYQKIVTTTAATKMLRMSAACNATAYDIEFQVVAAGGAAPTTTGMALLAGDDFPQGFPIGDIYARSATSQKLIVWST